jgi:hypothetical protein
MRRFRQLFVAVVVLGAVFVIYSHHNFVNTKPLSIKKHFSPSLKSPTKPEASQPDRSSSTKIPNSQVNAQTTSSLNNLEKAKQFDENCDSFGEWER